MKITLEEVFSESNYELTMFFDADGDLVLCHSDTNAISFTASLVELKEAIKFLEKNLKD